MEQRSNTWSEELLDFDREHIWHPYTSMTSPLPVFPVKAATGVMLELADGRQLIDGMASWWSAIHGYNHPVLNETIRQQSSCMSHVMFGGLTHEPAIRLAQTLIDITDESLQHVFFADSGSVAMEVGLKMAIQYWYAQGKPGKSRMLTVRNGYHGDTFGAMSVTDPENSMHHLFQHVLPKHFFAPAPECSSDSAGNIRHNANELEAILREHHHEIAAIVLEPLVQGAGGMRFYCPEYLQTVRGYCDDYGVLLIFDEIATGFARTGTLFAYEQTGIVPDIMAAGKALTGGYMTLAAVLCSARIANGISADGQGVLMHGPTFMANPLACSVAHANIQLLLDSDWQNNMQRLEKGLQQGLKACANLPQVADVRVKGGIGVVELHKAVNIADIQPRFVEQGVWVRPFGKLVYVMPPYIITDAQLETLCRAIVEVVSQ